MVLTSSGRWFASILISESFSSGLAVKSHQMQTSTDILIGSMIGLLAAFLWAMATNVYKSQSDEATPLSIAAIKTWLSFFVMSVLVILPFRPTPFFIPPEAILYLASSVTIGLIIGDLLFLTSQERIGVSYAYPIAATYPIFTYIIAIFVVQEVLLLTRFLGILLAVGGIILISREQSSSEGDISKFDKVGLSFALLAAICWSIGSVLLQIGVTDVEPVDANWVRMIFGAGVIAPIYFGYVKRGMPKPSRRATKIVLVAAFFGMAWGSLLYTMAVKLIGATVASVVGSVSPLFAQPISILFLK
ncbi:MAG: DMT family transporter [Candidatus Thorarchaeota archaeon]